MGDKKSNANGVSPHLILPEDATPETVGGPGKEWWANGRNWEIYPKWLESERKKCEKDGRGPYWGEWRVETHPGAARRDDRFLHVLTAASTNETHGVKARLVRTDTQDGVELSFDRDAADGGRETVEMTVLFNREGEVGGEVCHGIRRKNCCAMSSFWWPLLPVVIPQSGVLLR